MSDDAHGEVPINSEGDIVTVRKAVRAAATELGFGVTDVTRIVTAASELARNVFVFARSGMLRWRALVQNGRTGVELVFDDRGPGIADIERALEPGFTTAGGLGLGLPGAKRLMDEIDIRSEAGRGTTITVRKWSRR
jgi:serine/threonine-protein kinase RsbT